MKLGANLPQLPVEKMIETAQRAERLGLDSLWRGEAYGGDALVPLAFAAARTSTIKLGTSIMQIPARTPAMAAMGALSLDSLSGGRFICGIGMSGPQVVEGWHGVPYVAPLTTTREYVAIMREIFQGDHAVRFDGKRFQLPYVGEDGLGLGRAMRPAMTSRPDIEIFIAAIGPKNVEQTTEIADGLLPMLYNPHRVAEGLGDAVVKAMESGFAVNPTVPVAVGDDLQACRDKVRPILGLYIGGMGAKGKNFYNSLVRRYGFDEAADKIQDAFLDGRREEAIALVPDELVDELALVGPKERIAEHLEAWKTSGIDTLIISAPTRENLETMAELVL